MAAAAEDVQRARRAARAAAPAPCSSGTIRSSRPWISRTGTSIARQLVLGQRQRVDPALPRRREQLAVVRLRAHRARAAPRPRPRPPAPGRSARAPRARRRRRPTAHPAPAGIGIGAPIEPTATTRVTARAARAQRERTARRVAHHRARLVGREQRRPRPRSARPARRRTPAGPARSPDARGASASASDAHAAPVVPGPEPCSSSTVGPGIDVRRGRRRARARS